VSKRGVERRVRSELSNRRTASFDAFGPLAFFARRGKPWPRAEKTRCEQTSSRFVRALVATRFCRDRGAIDMPNDPSQSTPQTFPETTIDDDVGAMAWSSPAQPLERTHRPAPTASPPVRRPEAFTGGEDLAARRRAIIAASLDLGSEQGDDAVTIRGIASRVGVSPTALYQYFASKADLLHAVATEGDVRLRHALDEALSDAKDPADALVRISMRYIDFAARNPWLYTIMEREAPGAVAPMGGAGATAFMSVVSPCFRDESGQLRRDDVDPKVAPLLLWIAVNGLARVLAGEGEAPRTLELGPEGEARMIETYVRVLIRGLSR
jgi:AcrR family transcriptional regulator